MEQLVALLMLAAVSHGNCLVDVNKYIELITTTDNYKVVETLKGPEAVDIKQAIDAVPPPMERIEAMVVDRIHVMVSTDTPSVARLIYSNKGCLQITMAIPGRMYLQMRYQSKNKPTL